MKCMFCGEDCSQDYFVLDISRIQNGQLLIPEFSKYILCLKDYTDLYKNSSIRFDNNDYNEEGIGV